MTNPKSPGEALDLPLVGVEYQGKRPYVEGEGVATVTEIKSLVCFTVTFDGRVYRMERDLESFNREYPKVKP